MKDYEQMWATLKGVMRMSAREYLIELETARSGSISAIECAKVKARYEAYKRVLDNMNFLEDHSEKVETYEEWEATFTPKYGEPKP